MSTLASLYNITFDVSRQSTASSTSTDTILDVVVNVPGLIRPISKADQLFNIANMGKEYALFCDSAIDIRANDMIAVDGVSYGVSGVSVFDDLDNGEESHIEARILKVQ